MTDAGADRRYIRLKEQTPDVDVLHAPTEKYRRYTDGTLGPGPFRARADKHGFLLTGNPAPPKGPPLVFLGGSFVESMFAPEQTRFVAQTESILGRYRCLNGGYSGSTTLQLLNVLVNKLPPLVPRGTSVVFFVPQSDSDVLGHKSSYWTRTARHAPILPSWGRAGPDAPFAASDLTAMLEIVTQASTSLELNLVLATGPIRDTPFDGPDHIIWRRFGTPEHHAAVQDVRRQINVVTRAFARRARLPLVDADRMLGGEPQWFYDDLHLNEAGHDRFAPLLAEELGGALAERSRAGGWRPRRVTDVLTSTRALMRSTYGRLRPTRPARGPSRT